MNKELLLEVGTEEIPAKFMKSILVQLQKGAESLLQEANLTFTSVRVQGTPRRLVLQVAGLADRQADVHLRNRGPSAAIAFDDNGNPTKAVLGFARGQHIDVSELIVHDGYVYADVVQSGKETAEVLPELFTALLTGLQFPKSMRWGEETFRFVRPIRWIVALLDDAVIPFSIAGVTADRHTRGHRFMGHAHVEIPEAAAYEGVMAAEYVMVDPEERRRVIMEGLDAAAAEINGKVLHDADLLEEVVYLVEYPTVLRGRFAEHFLQLPVAAVVTPMKDHQRYFPVVDQNGSLLPVFLTVRNGGKAFLDTVRIGNERVLRARLSDAQFFFNEDRKRSLAERYSDLDSIVFQEGLGNLQDKTARLQRIAAGFANAWQLSQEEQEALQRAVHLSKTDLTTAMVIEFTELQGEIGREYARLDGEPEAVAAAIGEQYLPRFAGDVLPRTTAGTIISLADKLDNLVALFSRGHIPSGSQDPFALRRQAIGIVQMALREEREWSLERALTTAAEALGTENRSCIDDVRTYVMQRLRHILEEKGIAYDVLDAVFDNPSDVILHNVRRVQALVETELRTDEVLLQALIRVLNLAPGEEVEPQWDEALATEPAERALAHAVEQVRGQIESAYATHRYGKVYTALQQLIAPINTFFEQVIVMDKEEAVKQNRLGLLRSIADLILPWADVRKLAR